MSEHQAILKNCPYCNAEINRERYIYTAKKHCGSQNCRSAQSREKKREERRLQAEKDQQKVRAYAQTIKHGAELLTIMDDHGQGFALQIVAMIDANRCKHIHLAQIHVYVDQHKQARQDAEAHSRNLEAEYQRNLKTLAANYEQQLTALKVELAKYQELDASLYASIVGQEDDDSAEMQQQQALSSEQSRQDDDQAAEDLDDESLDEDEGE